VNLTDSLVGETIYYRGFDSQFSVFENPERHNFTWVTDDPYYALEYAEGEHGRVAIVELMSVNIGSPWELTDDDYLSPSDEAMEDLYSRGLCGYWFYANHDSSYCLCANPASFTVREVLNAQDFKELLSKISIRACLT